MKRFSLGLPVCLLGLPLLAALLFSSVHNVEKGTAASPTPAAPEVGDGPLPDDAGMEKLAKENPIAFLENCLRRYQREVKGYRANFVKEERIGKHLNPPETIDVSFLEKPHSVFFSWRDGARKAERALYVEAENDGKMLARPYGRLARLAAGDVVIRDVDGPDARQSGRYTLAQFGIKNGTVRTLAAWKAAKEKDALEVKYLGKEKVKDAGNRLCYVLKRTNAKPENDGVTQLTIYVDTENWLQIGSLLEGEGGKLIARYFFRDIELNPKFDADQFKEAALKPK